MTSLESFTSGAAIAVDFTAIDRELTSLWKLAADSAGDGAGRPAVMRACQINLIVLCASSEEALRATSTLAPVMRECPARVLMAVLADEGEGLEAAISAHCSFLPGEGAGRQVCCEQVTLTAAGDSMAHLPGAVLPLLLPDLPVVVWWPGSVASSPRALEARAQIAHMADRVVFDSRRLARPAAEWTSLAALGCPMADLSWLRLVAWREMTASLFEGPVFSDYPERLRRIRVTRAGSGGGGHAESLLLASWVAASLGWRPVPGDGADRRLIRSDGSFGEIHLEEVAGQNPTEHKGHVTALELHDTDASFVMRRDGDAETIMGAVDLPGTCGVPRTVRAVERDDATLLCRALHWGASADRAQEAALIVAARLDAPISGATT